jgi:hypothetical protein
MPKPSEIEGCYVFDDEEPSSESPVCKKHMVFTQLENSTSGLSKRDRSAPLPGQAASTRSECEAQCKLHEARRRQRRNVLAELCRVIG